MKIRSWLLTLLLICAVSSMSAQEIVVIDGAKYAIHDVAKGETLYSLARRYGVTVDEIKGANAALAEGLKAGQRIKIPVKVEESAPQSVATPQVRVHKVMKGETLYSLAKMNGLSVEELQAANPHIRKGLKAGQLIDIPQRGAATEPSQGETIPNLTPAPTQTESVLHSPQLAVLEQIGDHWPHCAP